MQYRSRALAHAFEGEDGAWVNWLDYMSNIERRVARCVRYIRNFSFR